VRYGSLAKQESTVEACRAEKWPQKDLTPTPTSDAGLPSPPPPASSSSNSIREAVGSGAKVGV